MALYLLSELLTTLAIEGWLWQVGGDYNAPSYAVVYCIFRAVDLAFAFNLARPDWRAEAVGLAYLAGLWLIHPHATLNGSIALLEGAAFECAGVAGLINQRNRKLAVMWLLLACYDAGYAVGWQLPKWAALNDWWTYIVCTTCFTWVGVELAGRRNQYGARI